jgi:hypothetical protein
MIINCWCSEGYEAVMAYLAALSWYSLGGTEEKHECIYSFVVYLMMLL